MTPGAKSRAFDGSIALPSMWVGGYADPSVLVRGIYSVVNVRVEQVDYEDGTSWRTWQDVSLR